MVNRVGARYFTQYPFLINALLSIGAGVALWLAAAPHGMWYLIPVGIGALWLAVHGQRWGRAGLWGTVAGFTYFYLLFDWAQAATNALVPRIALAGIEALFLGLTAIIWAGLWRGAWRIGHSLTTLLALILSALAWVGVEEIRAMWPFGGLPWGIVGYSLVSSPFVKLAPLGSTQLVGAVIALVGIMLGASAAYLFRLKLIRSVLSLVTAGVIALVVAIMPLAMPESQGSLQVGIVQGNTPTIDLAPDAQWATTTLTNHVSATETIADQQPDLVLWPESASERDMRVDDESAALVQQALNAVNVPILLGTQNYFKSENGDSQRLNDYVVAYPAGIEEGSVSEPYSKQHPVPFGEYMPYRDFFRTLSSLVDLVPIDMIPGTTPATLSVTLADGSKVSVATPICFEVAYTGIVTEGALASDFIVVPTSNATFDTSNEAFQQFDMTRFRAVETGREAIQVSNMGTSGLVHPNGTVEYSTDLWTVDSRVVTVERYTDATLAMTTIAERTRATLIVFGVSLVLGIAGLFAARQRFYVDGDLASIGI